MPDALRLIPARAPLVDLKTGVMTRDWYRYLEALYVQRLTNPTGTTLVGSSAVTLTGIPFWVRKVSLVLDEVSLTAGGSNLIVQLGAGGVATLAGYTGSVATAPAGAAANFSAGFVLGISIAPAVLYGTLTLHLCGTNRWMASGTFGRSDVATASLVGGAVTLPGSLDTIVVTTAAGTDTFDAGVAALFYE